MKVREPIGPACGISVLIVDDDAALRALMSECFVRHGMRVGEAANGVECLAAVERERFDAIFMDIIMPVKDGIETIVALRARGVRTTIIAISSGGPEANFTLLEAAKAVGADLTMRKPFNLVKIGREIPELLRKLVGTAQAAPQSGMPPAPSPATPRAGPPEA
jgi:CheY-like chemotaxis protein